MRPEWVARVVPAGPSIVANCGEWSGTPLASGSLTEKGDAEDRRALGGGSADKPDPQHRLDFETANYDRASACALGVAVIEDGAVTVRAETLIRPPEACGRFRDDFISIHGITPDAVRDAPAFDAVFEAFRPHLEGAVLAAHNAPFDMGVLGALLGCYGIPFACESLCTLRLARAAWPGLRRHNLAAVAAHLGVGLDHHRAGSDAYAAARILLALRDCSRPALTPYLRRYDWTGG